MEANYASHLNHPVFKVISKELESSSDCAFVIGGFVRDLVLGNKSKDIDIVVQGDGLFSLRKLLKHYASKKYPYLKITALRISNTRI
jgi:tRNA nucleotidyltransferase/poly(A) polymerase